MDQTVLIITGLAGLVFIFGPEAWKVLQKAWLNRPAPQPDSGPEPVQDPDDLADGALTISLEDQDRKKVLALAQLTSIRRMLVGHTQAQEAIDSILVPAVMKAEASQR